MRIGKLRVFSLHFAFLCVISSTLSAQTGTGAAWKHFFDQPVDWFFRTSSEFLIVRSANSLSAIAPSRGNLLWSVPDLQYEGSETRGRNVLEIPGFSILLVNRAKLPNQPGLHLLGLDLQTGKILWQIAALDDLVELRRMESDRRVLLITHKTDKLRKGAEIALHAANYYVAGPYSFRPIFTKLDPATGHIDWSSEFPSTITPRSLDFIFRDSLLCFDAYSDLDNFRVGCVDAANGQQIWNAKKNTHSSYTAPPLMQIEKGILLLPSNCVTAYELKSGKTLWTTRNLGKLYDLIVAQHVAVTVGSHGVTAFDSSTGHELWKLKTSGPVFNAAYWPAQSALAFLDNRDLTIVRIHDGSVLRKTAHHFGPNPEVILTLGDHFALVLGRMNSVQYDLRSGEYVTSLPKADMAFPAKDFAVRTADFRNPLFVGPRRGTLPNEFCRQPEPDLIAANPTDSALNRCGDPGSFNFVFAAKGSGNSWKFWYFNSRTNQFMQFSGTGQQPDASLSLNRAYFAQRNQLTSSAMNSD